MPMKVLYTIKTRGWRPTALDEVEPPDPNRMVGWKGLAEHVDVSLKTAQRMVSAGTLPRPIKLGKRKVGFKIADVDAALAKMRR